jgi:hypothetical protein
LDRFFGGSICQAIQTLYLDYDWKPWRFSTPPETLWTNLNMQREYFDWISTKLVIQKPEDWQEVQAFHLNAIDAKATRLIDLRYGGSLFKALQNVYPEFLWRIWMFERVQQSAWGEISFLKAYIEWLADKLNIVEYVDWYSVSSDQVNHLKGGPLLKKNNLFFYLAKVFPNHPWDKLEHQSSISKSQLYLSKSLQKLFPQHVDIQSNFREAGLVFHRTKYPMELDVYIPSLFLAFEYQGKRPAPIEIRIRQGNSTTSGTTCTDHHNFSNNGTKKKKKPVRSLELP